MAKDSVFRFKPFMKDEQSDIFDACCINEWRKSQKPDVAKTKKLDMMPCCGDQRNQSIQPPSNVFVNPPSSNCAVLLVTFDSAIIPNNSVFPEKIDEGEDMTFNDLVFTNTGSEVLSINNMSANNGITVSLVGVTFPIVLAPGASTGIIAGAFITSSLPVGTAAFTVTTLAGTAKCPVITHNFSLELEVDCTAPTLETIKINGNTCTNPFLFIPPTIAAGVPTNIFMGLEVANPSSDYNASVLSTNPTQLVNGGGGALPPNVSYTPTLPLANETIPPSGIFTVGAIGGDINLGALAAGVYEFELLFFYYICTNEYGIIIHVQVNVI